MSEEGKERPKSSAATGDSTPAPVEFADVGSGRPAAAAGSIDMLMDVTLNVRIELGRTRMSVEDVLNLQGDSVVTLERLAGAVVQMLVWVGVVVVFIYAAVYLIRRYVPSARNMFGSGVLKVVGRTYVSSKQCILLVKVGPKYVMVGVTGTSMTPLAEVAEPADAAKISEELIEKSGGSIAGSFRQELRRADDDYAPSVPVPAVAADPSTSLGAGGTDAGIQDIRSELEAVTKKMKWWRRQGVE